MGSFLQDVMQQATNAILRGGTIQAPTVSAKTIAEQLAEKINAKLNYVPIEKQEEEKQDGGQNESFKRYEEELEINDFPQASKHFANDYRLTSIAWTVITPITCFVSIFILVEITTSVVTFQLVDSQCFGCITENIPKTNIPYYTKIFLPSATDLSYRNL